MPVLKYFNLHLITQGKRKKMACITSLCTLFFILLSYQCDAQRFMATKESEVVTTPENPTKASDASVAYQYCIYPPAVPFPPLFNPAPPPPPIYFQPIFPTNPAPPTTVPSPPEAIPISPPSYVLNPPPICIPNPPVVVPGSPGSTYPPVFQPPVVYPPPSAPPPPAGPTVLWCVAKPAVPDPIIQEAMDYACGFGAECDLIKDGGPCFSPNTVLNHASFAFNSYWQRTKVAGGTCDFGGIAILISEDPSYDGCPFTYS